jgi:hypothetical protein
VLQPPTTNGGRLRHDRGNHGDPDRHLETLTKLPSSTLQITADQAALEAFMAAMAPQ